MKFNFGLTNLAFFATMAVRNLLVFAETYARHLRSTSTSIENNIEPRNLHYESNNGFDCYFEKVGNGFCLDEEGRYFDYLSYDFNYMAAYLSNFEKSSWNEYAKPRACASWCFSFPNDDYFQYFIGFEIDNNKCFCMYDEGFSRKAERNGLHDVFWPGGEWPICETDGNWEAECYRFKRYHG